MNKKTLELLRRARKTLFHAPHCLSHTLEPCSCGIRSLYDEIETHLQAVDEREKARGFSGPTVVLPDPRYLGRGGHLGKFHFRFSFPRFSFTGEDGETHEDGVHVELLPSLGGESPFVCALVSPYDETDEADIGLEWNDGTLCGFDGAFELPPPVRIALQSLGYAVNLESSA